ncbi:hypothetical protein G9A89_014510 [Geosiphon pyriformis]|nr:hypothetical protein G9A89_014510 [Geosiphon pyriformis]
MVALKGVIAVAVSLVALIILILTFPKSNGKAFPEQEPSLTTGFPTWHSKLKNFNFEKKYAAIGFAFTFESLGGILAIKWAYNKKQPRQVISYFYNGVTATITTSVFNHLIALYTIFTALAGLATLLFDIGKLWETFGVFHNLWEVAVLLLLQQGGKINNISRYILTLGIYIFSVHFIVVFLNWPLDATFFKFQGLIFDFALAIVFPIIYISTRKHVREEAETHIPLDNQNDPQEHQEDELKPYIIDHPKQLLLLVVASLVHVFGNLANTAFASSATADIIFHASYAISFSLYPLYVFLDTHGASVLPHKRIYLPEPPVWKIALIFIWSTFLSLSTIRFLVAAPEERA